MDDRPTQRAPDIQGAGLLGEEQFDVALLLSSVFSLQAEERAPDRFEAADIDLIKKQLPTFELRRCLVGVEIIAEFQEFMLFHTEVKPTMNMKEIWKVATENTWLQARHYISSAQSAMGDTLKTFSNGIANLPNPMAQSTLRRISSVIPIFLNRIGASDFPYVCKIEGGIYVNGPAESSPKLTLTGSSGLCEIVFGRKLVVISLNRQHYLLSHDQWVMIHNKCVEIWIVLLHAFLGEGIQYTKGFHKRVIRLLKIYHSLIRRHGNSAYKFMKNLEGLITGLVIHREESWNNPELMDTMWEVIFNDRLGFPRNYYQSSLAALLDECTTPELIELCGTSKLAGHPDIQTLKGMEQLKERTHRDIPITYESILEVIHMMKKDFCERYLEKHHRWPLVEIKFGCPEIFTQSILRNKWIEDPELTRLYGKSVSLNDWDFITLGQVMEFDWVEAHMPFLKDRALAPRLSQITMNEANRVRIPMADRRVLLKFLLTQNVFKLTDRFLEDYQEEPRSVIDYLVIKLTQKEKELKEGGRMFGQSPYEERFRRCIMEHNVARLMVDYDPYQSMTTSELQKILKLLKFRALSREVTNARVIQFSIDVEAWNNHFRPELVNAVGEEFFDKLLGVQLFKNTMTTYQLSYIYTMLNKQPFGWVGQDGGIEGLSQKVWTWIYARVALRVLESLGYKGYIMVCGDDLRLAVIFPNDLFNDKTEAEIAGEFKQQLVLAFEKYGFKMKVAETVTSETFIAYGKVYQVGDSFMSGVFKKIAKIHGFQGTTFPLIEQQVASIFSNAHAACQMNTSHVSIHILASLVTLIRLQGKCDKRLNKREMLEMLCRPSVLGGLPVLHLCHFMVRGESDHLSIAFSFAFFLISSGLNPSLGWSLICTPLSPPNKRNFLQLLSDPYCLPVDKPESATAYIKKRMEIHIRRITKNKAMRQVFKLYSRSYQTRFIKALESMNVYLAKVLAVIWECSPFNIINEVVQKFESSRSVFQLLCINRQRRQLYRLLETARKIEQKSLSWLRQLAVRLPETLRDFRGTTFSEIQELESTTHEDLPVCPTHYTQQIRNFSWGKPVLTVTYPCTIDFFRIYQEGSKMPVEVMDDHIWSILYLEDSGVNQHFCAGNRTPWVGTVTSEKLILPKVTMDFEGSISAKVSKILKLVEYTRCNGDCILQVIEWVLQRVSGYDLSYFYTLVPRRSGGTISHRLRSRAFHETVMANELPNRSQLISIHQDTHTSLQEKTGDFSVNYMALLIHHMTTILFPLECVSYIDERKYGRHFYSRVNVGCPDCFYDVTDLHLVEMERELPDIPPLPGTNPLVGFTTTLIDEIQRRITELGLRPQHQTFQQEQVADDVTPEIAMHIVSSALIQECFGGSQEAYLLGINITYESHQMKMDALNNMPVRSQLSIRDWKAVDGVSLVNAMIKECHQWVLKNPKLRTKRRDDIINLPPQLNPFTIIAQKLILSRQVLEVYQGFLTLNYATRPLGALDLSNNSCCSKWLLATIYPIVEAVFQEHALTERIATYFSYEADDFILHKLNRLMDIATLNYYQNVLRILYIVYLLEYPIEDALDYRFTATRLKRELRERVRDRVISQDFIADRLQACWRYLDSYLEAVGVNFDIPQVGFGKEQYFVTGNVDPDAITGFLHSHLSDLMAWPLPIEEMVDASHLPPLPFDTIWDLNELFEWPSVTVYRYGLYASVYLCRTLLDERESEADTVGVTRSLPCQPIIIGERQNAIRDVCDLTDQEAGSGGSFIADQLILLVPEYRADQRYPIPMTQFSRINGHTITSVVKLHEIFIRLDIHEKFERATIPFFAMCLADGAGGFTNYILKLTPMSRVIFNTLFVPKPDEPLAITTPGEVMLSADQRVINRCISQHNYTSSNDLTRDATIQILADIAMRKTDNLGLSLITFDAEGEGLDNNEIYFQLMLNVSILTLCTLSNTGTCIIKTFMSRNRKLWSLLNTYSDLFAYIRLIKPDTSHTSNSEFYLILSNPVFNLEARRIIARSFRSGRVYGPANFDFLHEAQAVCNDINQRRLILLQGGESPYNSLTWAVVNWTDHRLPPFTWGIIFRRLSIPAAANLVQPDGETIIWTNTLRQEIITLCQRTLHECRRTVETGESSVLTPTTHTHICFRFGQMVRILGFMYMIDTFPNNLCNAFTAGIEAITERVIENVEGLAQQISREYNHQDHIVNPSMENLEVNIPAEARQGILLGMRFRSAEHAYKYITRHGRVPAPPCFPNYEPMQIQQI